jgi:hypothetical protein
LRAGKNERKKWATGLCGEKEKGELAGLRRGKKWAGIRDSAHEAFGGMKNPFIFLGFDSNSNSNKFYTNPNTKHSINSK